MGTVPPTIEDLRRIAERYNLTLSDADLNSFVGLITPSMTSYDVVEHLYAELAPPVPHRRHALPKPEENPLNAWALYTELSTCDTGPLAGRRVVIKDSVAIGGVPMGNGSRSMRGFVPREDATTVRRLLDAGATIVGKGNCEDLCYSAGSHTSAAGPVRNPWDPARNAGGSSSGPAVLVATGEADLGLGSDQGGSIRVPAAFCGVVGHKPTHGLVPCTGAFAMDNTVDHLGPLTRTVRDAALMLGVLAGYDPLDPRQDSGLRVRDYLRHLDDGVRGLRVGLLTEGFDIPGLSESCVDDTVRNAAYALEQAGAQVVEISVPWHRTGLDVWKVIATEGIVWQMIDGNGLGRNWSGRYDPELVAHFGKGRAEHADAFSETVKMFMLNASYSLGKYHGAHYAMAQNLVPHLVKGYDTALAEVDVLVLPTVPHVAKPLPGPDASREEYVGAALAHVPNVAPFDASGHPATAVPAGLVDGLPVSMMIVAPHHRDDLGLRVARAVEASLGGFPPAPSTLAGTREHQP
ncbi:amidase [Crossiella equi]|uniref:Amidase n=2 Tax=Crossiella equi TaxID=130796 RepID=A0ABS5A7J5_9PSEU|nr:amidase [Crossiella equi]MBP2472567.1 amidase [Crossiella equi]